MHSYTQFTMPQASLSKVILQFFKIQDWAGVNNVVTAASPVTMQERRRPLYGKQLRDQSFYLNNC
jgi:hypothetical protein